MKAISRIIVFLFVCFIIINILIGLFSNEGTQEYYHEETVFHCDEYSIRDTSSNSGIQHYRSWQDSKYWKSYCSSYEIADDHYSTALTHRNGYQPPYGTYDTFHGYWGNIYKILLEHESSRLHSLQDSLQRVAIRDSLSRVEFADMVVSFVQDIPYSYIMSEACGKDQEGTPCLGNQKFGLLSPTEFLYSLKGDCDTRTTLLYQLLKYFDYDVAVVISSEYAHAMLAINLPITGDHLNYRGQRYYFWETTNVGWQPGMLGADMKNTNYWKIALI